MQPLSLYELTEELTALETALVEAGGEITPEIEETYAALLDAHGSKVQGYLARIRRLEVSAAAVAEERKRLQACEKTFAASAERLRERLLASMLRRGEREHTTELGRICVRQASNRPVELLVETQGLPERFKRVTVVPDLKALAQALRDEDAEALCCARLGEASPYLRIY